MSDGVGGISADKLRSLVERIERLESERSEISDAIKDVYSEVKSGGFEVRIVRQLIRLRKLDPNEVETRESLLHLYMHALGGA